MLGPATRRGSLRSVPLASLLEPEWIPFWESVWGSLDRNGSAHRGRFDVPAGLADSVRRRIGRRIGRGVPRDGRTLAVADLDPLWEHHGTDLVSVFEGLGWPAPARKDARVAARIDAGARVEALRAAARRWFADDERARAWIGQVRSGITDAAQARRAVDVVDTVLAVADSGRRRSRGEIAAQVLGSAHQLDRGTPERRWVRAALAVLAGGDPRRDDPELWAGAGLPGDLVSAPVLTWALPLAGDGVAAAVRALTAAGAPAPLTALTLRELAIVVPPGAVVLSVENPRLLESAAQQRLDAPMLCTSGEPTVPAVRLMESLIAAGAAVRHHGDFDPAGLAITARLHERRVAPWRMGVEDYRAAVAGAEADAVELLGIDGPVPATPWEPALAGEVGRVRLVVEEERVMDALLADHAREAGDRRRG